MSKILNFFKKQKLFIFLFLILSILLIIKFCLNQSKPRPTIINSPPSSPLLGPSKTSLPQPTASPPLFASPASNVFYDPTAEALKGVLEEKPWLLSLPITATGYSIDYLGEEKGFRVLMKIDITSSLPRQKQIDQIKKEAPEKLKQIGVNLSKEKVYYSFTP